MGGSYKAPDPSESMNDILNAIVTQYPRLVNATVGGSLPLEQSNIDVAKQTLPQWAQLNAEIAPVMQKQAAESALAQVASDTGAMKSASSPGGLIDSSVAAQRIADPEWYRMRALQEQKLSELLNSINPNGLSGGEEAQIEREINRNQINSGVSAPSAASTAERAMTFGNALDKKKSMLGEALTVTAQTMPTMKSGFDAFQQATGRSGSVTNAGTQFNNPSAESVGQASQNMTGNMLNMGGQLASSAMGANAGRKDTLDKVSQIFGMIF